MKILVNHRRDTPPLISYLIDYALNLSKLKYVISFSMAHGNRHLAAPQSLRDDVLAILPQLSGIADTEPVLEYLSYFLKRQAGYFRIAEVDQDPADATDGGVEAKSAGWSHALHHGEEGRGDDDVGTPARTIMRINCEYLGKSVRLGLLTKSGTLSPSHALP